MSAPPYAIGAEKLAGLSKLIEEVGESTEIVAAYLLAVQLGRVGQLAGKIMGIGDMDVEHWDGSNLQLRMVEELGDLRAAINKFAEWSGIAYQVDDRAEAKEALFQRWHDDHLKPPPRFRCEVCDDGSIVPETVKPDWTCASCGTDCQPF